MKTESNDLPEREEKETSYSWMYVTSIILLLFSVILTSNDRATQMITATCLTTSAFLSYLTIRKNLNALGILLLIISIYFLGALTITALTP